MPADLAMAPTPVPVQVLRCLRLVFCFLLIALRTCFIYPRVDAATRARLKQRGSRAIIDALGVELETGETMSPTGSLIVANHISWLDIFVINAVRPASFVAKSEVRKWPFIGWLAAKNDTVFLARGTRGHARTVNVEIDARLDAGLDVAIFPEGTTTDGRRLLAFPSALLQPAVETRRPIQPLAISYHDARGGLSTAAAFTGQTSLPQCFRAILASRSLKARVWPCADVDVGGKTRREACEQAHAAIATALARNAGFAAGATAATAADAPSASVN